MKKNYIRSAVGVFLAAILVGSSAFAPAQPVEARPQVRGIWIDSWGPGILTPEQCDELVETVRAANLNAIFPEIRKVGDAYYNGGLEPRAMEIEGDDDWDPLQYLIDKCHDTSDGKRYIEVHAWLVTFRIWKGPKAPPEGHLLNVHPEAAMLNAKGESAAKEAGGSMFADPGHPQAQEWTAQVFKDVAKRYDIDGIHHDYVRYPEYEGDWGHNPVSLQRFRERTGFEGVPEADNPMWAAWRRRQVQDVVRRVYAEVKEVNPDIVVSAATLNWDLEVDPWKWNTAKPLMKAQQDWPAMMEEGSLDMNSVMNYTRAQTQPHRFADYTDLAIRTRLDRHAIIGPGVYLNSVEDGFDQIREAIAKGADGINLYCWGSVSSDKSIKRKDYFKRLREEVFPTPVDIPARPWIDTPNEGIVMGRVTSGAGDWVDAAYVSLDGVDTVLTDATGNYAFLRVAPGAHSVSVQTADGKASVSKIEVTAGAVTREDIGL